MKKPEVVVVGTGFAGIRAAKKLEGKAKVTVVSPTDRFTFLPLVHELVSEESRPLAITRPVRDLLPKAKHVAGTAKALGEKSVLLENGDEIPFDNAIVAIGAAPHYFDTPGARENSLPFWSLEDGLRANAALKQLLLRPRGESVYRVVVVGAGATGLEVAGEAAAFFERYDAPYEVDVLEMRDAIFPQATKEFRTQVRKALERFHLRVLTRTAVKSIEPGRVVVQTRHEDPRGIRSDLTFWCAGVRGRTLAPLSMQVDWHLRSVDRPDVLIVGDCARFPKEGAPVPQLAQTAEQQGAVAAYNVLHPDRPRRYEPKLKGTILSVGPGYAIAETGKAVLSGRLPWHVKKQYYKWTLRRG